MDAKGEAGALAFGAMVSVLSLWDLSVGTPV